VTAAEFAEKVSVTERKLNDVFDLAAHWEAILLIDEADVILTRRTYADVERNAVVAGMPPRSIRLQNCVNKAKQSSSAPWSITAVY
jgi:hypothetical protein